MTPTAPEIRFSMNAVGLCSFGLILIFVGLVSLEKFDEQIEVLTWGRRVLASTLLWGIALCGALLVTFSLIFGIHGRLYLKSLALAFASTHAERVSAADGIDASAPCYGLAENVGVVPIVVPEFKFRQGG